MANRVSAPDIITYIGVPLAVLGVLPILYSFVRAILVQRSIRKTLDRHGLFNPAVTRGSLIEGIVEVELPRCTITPLDREIDLEYWKLNSNRVFLKGGNWTIFNWNTLVTGKQLYRCQYKDELRIPEADIDFEELVAFLLDRGAVPDPKGWRMLKSIGLWTPAGTVLLLPPRGIPGSVLKVTPPNNADGVLSLQVDWKAEWDSRGAHSLPPFWMRLEQPRYRKLLTENDQITNSPILEGQVSFPDQQGSSNEPPIQDISRENTLVAEPTSKNESSTAESVIQIIDNMKTQITTVPNDSVRFKVDGDHVRKVSFEAEGVPTGETREIDDLGETARLWFISSASAMCQTLNCDMCTFTIPSHLASFVKRKSVPCGVMVILDMLSNDEVPPWASPPPRLQETPQEMTERTQQKIYERRLENAMPPGQATEARRIRSMREAHDIHMRHIARQNALREYEQRRFIEAIQSPRLDNGTVAEATLAYLVREKVIPEDYKIQDVAKAVLYILIVDSAQAKVIVDILERWALWSQFGGMQKVQLDVLIQNKVAFCYAAALVAVVHQAQSEDVNISSADMLECLRVWKRVRLG
ncbi:hypothetical protein UA08_08164 [Talaromyces atroroseus]|uniref:Uncharacterized protein n=1 Tax=Talaromyces atroroseus TaxID=1441469 RepID=A0A225A7G1_TALAT|nr:hypothetical protein UA08_08164 [Talaromyces atroroseus]OKL56442.1 hypothetical protein UA08_08164 [Talaromyces atroroseus]